MTLEKKQITCIKCGETKPSDEFYYHRIRKYYMKTCKKCNSKICATYQKSQRTINDLGYITQHRASEIRRNCKYKTNRECASNLTALLRQQWELQKGLCFYTGLPMELTNDYHTNPNVMTVDRVDPTKGYIEGNIVWCCSLANRMKQDMSIEKLKEMCLTIVKHLELPQGA